MANPPYSGSLITLEENQDGIIGRVYHWVDITGVSVPKGVGNIESAMFAQGVDVHQKRMCTTRTALKNAFAAFVDNQFPDTAA